MTYLLIALVLVFIVLAMAVFSRLGNISKDISEDRGDGSGVSGNLVNARLFLAFLILGLIGTAWTYLHARNYFLPEASSVHGRRTDDLFWFSMGLLTIAFIIVNVLIFYFSYKYRYKKGNRATFFPENHRLEIIWTLVPAVVMAVLVLTGWRAWSDIMSEAPKDAEVVEIMGKQFNWLVRYPGADDHQLGRANYKFTTAQNEMGIDFSDSKSFDDFMASEVHIPVNKPVHLKIKARDVLHSVFIPHMRVKMDAVPGMPTRFWFVPDKTTNEMRSELGDPNFNYELTCTEICGNGHYGMRTILVVDDQATYDKWYAEQPTFLQTYPETIDIIPEELKPQAMKYVSKATTAADSTEK